MKIGPIIPVILSIIIVGLTCMAMFSLYKLKGNVVQYNCELAEISPDFPIKVKEECRNLRMNRYK